MALLDELMRKRSLEDNDTVNAVVYTLYWPTTLTTIDYTVLCLTLDNRTKGSGPPAGSRVVGRIQCRYAWSSVGYRRRRRHTTTAVRGSRRIHMEAATKWAVLPGVPGWENDCGSHPQQHHRVWFKFVDLVTRIGSARLRCTGFEVFDHFYAEIGFKKYRFFKKNFSFILI